MVEQHFPTNHSFTRTLPGLKAENDYVIVSCHWGQELKETPKPYQIQLAHQLIDKGVDLILGHHPHVVQGIEFYKNRLIAYSLGNFVFGSFSERVRDSMILKLTLTEEGTSEAEIMPINVYNKDVVFQPVPLTGNVKRNF